MPHPETSEKNPMRKELAEFFDDARDTLEEMEIDIDPPDPILEDVVLMAMGHGITIAHKLMVAGIEKHYDDGKDELVKKLNRFATMATVGCAELQNGMSRESFATLKAHAVLLVQLAENGISMDPEELMRVLEKSNAS